MAFLIGGANSAADTAYSIDNSCRFNDDDSPYLTISSLGSTASDAKKWTVSFWTKLGSMGSHRCFFSVGTYPSPDENSQLNITNVDTLQAYSSTTFGEGGSATNIKTNAVYRDSAAWYHIVWAMDSTESTNTDRIKLYVNGVRVTSFGTASNYPAEDTENDLVGANSVPHYVGQYVNGSQYNDTYMAEFYFIDGTAYDADDFGETDEDSGIWKPKNASVTFGNNGFFLEFKASGVGTASSSTIGADTSGNDNHFTSSGLTVLDQCTDSPTNNFSVLRISKSPKNSTVVLAEGNCDFDYTQDGSDTRDGQNHCVSTIGMSAGKWYCECKILESATAFLGIENMNKRAYNDVVENWNSMYLADGEKYLQEYTGQGVSNATHGAAVSAGDIVMIALDMDNKNIYFGNGGSWADGSGNFDESSPNSAIAISDNFLTIDGDGSNAVFGFMSASSSASPRFQVNFGNPVHSISSSNADANGYGNFEYAVPTNYYALCTKNLAEFGG